VVVVVELFSVRAVVVALGIAAGVITTENTLVGLSCKLLMLKNNKPTTPASSKQAAIVPP
jgi:hypothetical protein